MTHPEAARLIWQVLIAAADQRQILTYELISQKIDHKLPAVGLTTSLDLIAAHCVE